MIQPQQRPRGRFRRLAWRVLLATLAGVLALGGYYLYVMHVRHNFHTVAEGLIYRAGQPPVDKIAEWHRDYGIKSIINLRGEQSSQEYAEEAAMAARLGIELHAIGLSASRQPESPTFLALLQAIETAPSPLLVHCLAGADRTGVASVIAKMARDGQSYQAALDQLSLRYFRFDKDPANLGGILTRYERWCREAGLDTAGYAQFKAWASDFYHEYFQLCITAPQELTLRPGEETLTEITVQNCSRTVLPADDPQKTFTLAVFTGSSLLDRPEAEHGPRIPLPRRNLLPGESVIIRQPLKAPAEPGTYLIHHDLIEENRTWFARQGSPVPTCRLTVAP